MTKKKASVKRTPEDAKRAQDRKARNRDANEAAFKANQATVRSESIGPRDEVVLRHGRLVTKAVRPSKLIRSERRAKLQQNRG